MVGQPLSQDLSGFSSKGLVQIGPFLHITTCDYYDGNDTLGCCSNQVWCRDTEKFNQLQSYDYLMRRKPSV